MSTAGSAVLKKSIALDPDVLGPGSALSLELGGSTDADVLEAVARNEPFPVRPSGGIEVGHLNLEAGGGNPVAFRGGATTVGFKFAASVTAGAGIFDDPETALKALGLDETPGLDLTVGAESASRYALLRTGYSASAGVSGSHPVGVLGSFTFGAGGAAAGLSAVLHRFTKETGAGTALQDTVRSWKLPRHVDAAGKLAPATWLVTEVNGSLSVKIAADLGYNFNFVRETKAVGLSGDIGLKIDAGATATFGLEVSGRYLVVLGRESDREADQRLRLRLFKLSSNGMQFGLNLKVGVTAVETLTPSGVDEFVSAVFGVHGAQIVTALQQIEKWTNPDKSVGQLVAGLVNDKALELIKETTGVDPAVAFDTARGKLLDAINLYQSLPGRVSSELLGFINKLSPAAATDLEAGLTLLASPDAQTQRQAFDDLLGTTGFADSPIGKVLYALADNGLLNLLDRLPEVRGAATTILSILQGGVIAKLESYINDKLNLNNAIGVVQEDDFNHLDSFLIGRLSTFFDKTLSFADLDDVKNAVNLVVGKRQEIYDKARTALNSRYGLDLAATWQRTTTRTAVIDAVFDMAEPSAQQLFKDLVSGTDSALDRLIARAEAGVKIKGAVLSHELSRETTVEVSLPQFNFQTQSVTSALAHVRPEDDGGRVLLYDATGTNTVNVRKKFASSLSMTIAAAVSGAGPATSFPDLRIHSTDGNTWSYQLLYVKPRMKREELEAITRPFITHYMASQFALGTSLSVFYNQLEDTSEKRLQNGPETYGDVCASFEVTLPGDTLGAWALPVLNIPAAARAISVAIQASLKDNLPLFYLNDISKLANLASAAPLLAWASIPPAVSFDGSVFGATAGNDVFWDHVDVGLRQAAALHPVTQANLRAKLSEYRLRLEEAGLHGTVQFYQDDQAGVILTSATTPFGDVLLASLLTFESEIVRKAKDALSDIQKFVVLANTSPIQAVDRLAQFAADIATAFNHLLGDSVFADLASFRAVGQSVLAEASRALRPGVGTQARAMLTLDILNPAPPRTFPLSSFLAGALPAGDDIAVAQRLVRA